jgi:hypothetical protein
MNSKAPSPLARRLRSSSSYAVTSMTGRSGRRCFDLAEQLQPVHARHVDLGQDRSQSRLNLPRKPDAAKCIT